MLRQTRTIAMIYQAQKNQARRPRNPAGCAGGVRRFFSAPHSFIIAFFFAFVAASITACAEQYEFHQCSNGMRVFTPYLCHYEKPLSQEVVNES